MGERPGRGRFPDPDTFLPYPVHEPEVLRGLALLGHLGLPAAGGHLEFPVTDDDRDQLETIDPAVLRPGCFAVLHPGANQVKAPVRAGLPRAAGTGGRARERGAEIGRFE